jgi:hypothetical protein
MEHAGLAPYDEGILRDLIETSKRKGKRERNASRARNVQNMTEFLYFVLSVYLLDDAWCSANVGFYTTCAARLQEKGMVLYLHHFLRVQDVSFESFSAFLWFRQGSGHDCDFGCSREIQRLGWWCDGCSFRPSCNGSIRKRVSPLG